MVVKIISIETSIFYSVFLLNRFFSEEIIKYLFIKKKYKKTTYFGLLIAFLFIFHHIIFQLRLSVAAVLLGCIYSLYH